MPSRFLGRISELIYFRKDIFIRRVKFFWQVFKTLSHLALCYTSCEHAPHRGEHLEKHFSVLIIHCPEGMAHNLESLWIWQMIQAC